MNLKELIFFSSTRVPSFSRPPDEYSLRTTEVSLLHIPVAPPYSEESVAEALKKRQPVRRSQIGICYNLNEWVPARL